MLKNVGRLFTKIATAVVVSHPGSLIEFLRIMVNHATCYLAATVDGHHSANQQPQLARSTISTSTLGELEPATLADWNLFQVSNSGSGSAWACRSSRQALWLRCKLLLSSILLGSVDSAYISGLELWARSTIEPTVVANIGSQLAEPNPVHVWIFGRETGWDRGKWVTTAYEQSLLTVPRPLSIKSWFCSITDRCCKE